MNNNNGTASEVIKSVMNFTDSLNDQLIFEHATKFMSRTLWKIQGKKDSDQSYLLNL